MLVLFFFFWKKLRKVIIGTNQIHIINKLVLIEPNIVDDGWDMRDSDEILKIFLPSVKDFVDEGGDRKMMMNFHFTK